MSVNSDIPARGAIPMRDSPSTPTRLAVAVVMRVTPTPEHRWMSERLETLAVIPADVQPEQENLSTTPQSEVDGIRVIRHDGLVLELHPDEAESYYFNLMVENPRCFVAFEGEEGERPIPFLVTPSFDLAASYEEGDQRVDSVPLDPALYPNIEAFVLSHYAPEKKVKRKRREWRSE